MTGVNAPHNLDAERGILGLLLTTGTSRAIEALTIEEGLQPSDFHLGQHQAVYAAVLALHDRGAAPDAVAVAAETGLESAALDGLTVAAASIGAVRQHARIVKRCALRRAWQNAGQRLLEAAATDDETLVAQAEQQLAAPTATDDTHSKERIASDVFAYFAEEGQPGISTGFVRLDEIIGGGLRPGDTTAIAAWRGTGKSVLADGMLEHAARSGARAHLYMNEMSSTDRALRAIARDTDIPYWRLTLRRLRDSGDRKQIVRALDRLPFAWTDISSWHIDSVCRHIRVNRWDLCCLDLLHNIPYERTSELDAIIQKLAAATRAAGSHLLLVCQFNEERAKSELLPAPVIRDLRGSGMIANVAANVLLLHREQEMVDGTVVTSPAGTLIAHKARHGRQGDGIDVSFDASAMRFELGRLPSAEREAA